MHKIYAVSENPESLIKNLEQLFSNIYKQSEGEGGKALWFTSGEYPLANPMEVNRNGKTIRTNNQSTGYSPF